MRFFRYNKNLKWVRNIFSRFLNLYYPLVVWRYPLPKVMSITETLQRLNDGKSSIIRFGDGEILYLIDKLSLPFQAFEPALADKMQKILQNKYPDLLVGLPSGYHSITDLNKEGKRFWKSQICWGYPRFRKYLDVSTLYANASITRIYIEYDNKSRCSQWFGMFKKIWENKHVVIVEGTHSRIGVGNNLLAKTASVQRIIAPNQHAYAHYDAIVQATLTVPKDRLILIALGPCAKAVAFELYKKGYRVIDIGNLDIEYEWFLRGAVTKIKIPGKYTSEALGGREVEELQDLTYQSQIIRIIS